MCNEYSVDYKCDNKAECKLLKILKENKSLKQEIKKLKEEVKNLRINNLYMINPNAIGDRHEMGCW